MKALIIVDIQNDFLPGGSLPVKNGHLVIPIINKLQKYFSVILATKDWHPYDHKSFAVQHHKKPFEVIDYQGLPQELWPIHCVQGTHGAEFASDLDTSKIKKIFYKGVDCEVDSYSAFFDNAHIRSTGLIEFLKHEQIDEVVLVGLATDYCVKYSILDAVQSGLKATVIKDACCGVEVQPGDIEKAYIVMEAVGANVLNSEDYIKTQISTQ